MKITICASSKFKEKMIEYKSKLLELWHEVIIHPDYEAFVRWEKQDIVKRIDTEHAAVKKENNYIQWYYNAIISWDAILVLNFEKNWIPNYIWWNTLMEIWFAYVNNKKIFLLNPIPDIWYKDEIEATYTEILNWDLSLIK